MAGNAGEVHSREVISCDCRGESAYTDKSRNKLKEHRSTEQEGCFNAQKMEGNCDIEGFKCPGG